MTARILADGSLYSGQWSSDDQQHASLPTGLGIRHYLSGRLYIGEWEAGVMHGKGLLLLESGDLFEGHFSRGAYHGRGFLYNRSDSRARRGVWKHGTILSVEDIIGNADDANFGTVFRSAPGASQQSHTVPQFKLMELQAVMATMRELRMRLEQHGQQQQQQQMNDSDTDINTHQQHQTLSSPPSAFLTTNAPDASATSGSGLGSSSHFQQHPRHGGGTALNIDQQQQFQQNQQQYAAMAAIANANQFQPSSGSGFGGVQLFQQQMQQQQQQMQQQPLDPIQQEQIASNQLLLTVSGPSYNFTFSPRRFLQFFSLFIFPFLSLPNVPICPLRMDGLDLEREYVVSGAALRADFEIPTWEIYFSAMGIVFLVVSAAIPHEGFTVGAETVFSWSDIIVPCVLCFIFALLQAAYQGYHRTAHALERLDRHHFPRLAALSAQCIDANCHTLVVSWDEEGLGRVINRKFQYKWSAIGFVYGFLLAFASPLTLIIRGQNAFGDQSDLTEVSAVLAFLSIWVFGYSITYQLWRIVDLERQLEESMGVITRCAYLQGQSIIRPSDTRKFKFHFDAPVSMENTSQGFLGWYITRSFALYASTLSNHRSRHAYVSVLTLAAIAIDAAFIVDTFRSQARGSISFTAAHMFGVVCMLGWGTMLLYFLYVAKNVDSESRKHLYLVDVAGMFHSFRDPQGASIVSRCRGMVAEHDYSSKVMGVLVTEKVFATALVFHGLAFSCMVLSLVMWGMQLQGLQSDLLTFND